MKAKKWLDKKHCYVDCEISDNCSVYEEDMNKEVDCCCCGKKIRFGDSYTSRHYHTKYGMGYAECEKCYFERKRDK